MHIISGELRKPPYVKPNVGGDGQSCLFIVELSEVIKDYKTGDKTYTNYSAALFAKGGQIDFYNTALVEGNFIVVTGDKLKVKVSDCGQYTKLELENARLENSKYIESGAQQQQQQPGGFAPQQQAPQQATQQQQYAPQQQQQTNPNFAPQQPQQQQQAPQQQMQQQAPQQQFAPQQQQQPQYAQQPQIAPQQQNPNDPPF